MMMRLRVDQLVQQILQWTPHRVRVTKNLKEIWGNVGNMFQVQFEQAPE